MDRQGRTLAYKLKILRKNKSKPQQNEIQNILKGMNTVVSDTKQLFSCI